MKTLLSREFISNWRSFRYPAFLLVALFFALLDPPLMKYMDELIAYFAAGIEIVVPDPTPGEVFTSYLMDVSQIGILVLVFTVMGCVAGERQRGVTAWILSKPVGRWQYLSSKLIVLYAVVSFGLLATSSVAYLYILFLFGTPSLAGSLQATLCLIVFTLFIATVTFCLSTLLKTPLQAGGLAMLLFFLGGILNLLVAPTAAARIYPYTLLAKIQPLTEGTAGSVEFTAALLVTLFLCILLIILAGIRFSRQEL